MLYYLKYPSHDIEKIQELLIYFFDKVTVLAPTSFDSNVLFPAWYNLAPIHKMNKVEALLTEFIGFPLIQRNEIIAAFNKANNIQALFSNATDHIPTAKDFDKYNWKISDGVQLTLKDFLNQLFLHLYKDQLGNKKSSFSKSIGTNLAQQYEAFLELNTVDFKVNVVCPFCGLEKMRDATNIRKPDHDHLLPKGDDLFVFSAVNIKNLFPIGSDCNIKKHTSVLLYEDDNLQNRTIAFYPFESPPHPFEQYTIILNCQEIPNLKNSYKGKWIVEIEPKDINDNITKSKIETWDRVFGIKERIAKVISDSNKSFLDLDIEITRINQESELDEKLKNLIKKYPMEYIYLSTIVDFVPKRIFFEWIQREPQFLRDYIPSNLGLSIVPEVDLSF
ncbi:MULTISPECIES: hypothetical protein [Chryseobacterium]|uniref:hypothetical protein n=1 Tax=Chryseobacterium TaxID=59732 RepID=UPI000F50D7EF|nr:MULTISPECIES: hypothetical protein [Chryseobacterium]AZB34798.1 hypothetical protein EG351_15055 [Chryseobacterium bernardetii]MBO9692655.1 hypothetical protein [Chryseobacterium sp.]